MKTLFLCCLLVLVAGCSTLRPAHKFTGPVRSWSKRQQSLLALDGWILRGAIAVKTPKTSGSANAFWVQDGTTFTLNFFGPLGAGSTEIKGDNKQVTLARSDGKKFQALTPESLMNSQLGWSLPISNLAYWVRGLPAPALPMQKKLDSSNRLLQLKQQGWTIDYQHYSTVGTHELPDKIQLKAPKLSAKLIISQWTL